MTQVVLMLHVDTNVTALESEPCVCVQSLMPNVVPLFHIPPDSATDSVFYDADRAYANCAMTYWI